MTDWIAIDKWFKAVCECTLCTKDTAGKTMPCDKHKSLGISLKVPREMLEDLGLIARKCLVNWCTSITAFEVHCDHGVLAACQSHVGAVIYKLGCDCNEYTTTRISHD